MRSKAELWADLQAANADLAAFAPALDANPVRSIALEREVGVNAAFFAGHLGRALNALGPDQRTPWLSALMTGDQGYVNEAYAYGTLAERNFDFTPIASVPSPSLYRTGTGTTDLDGLFPNVGIHFDIKSLSRPAGILENLLEAVNARINPNNRLAWANGSLDFDHQELVGAAFGTAVGAIADASVGNNSYSHPGLGVIFRFSDPANDIQTAEGVFNPYRFAQENRHIVITNAKQVPRTGRFMFVYVYSQLDHELATFPEHSGVGERAMARRVFCELTRDAVLASRFCSRTDPTATVGQIARSIGGLAFVRVRQRDAEADVRFYLNPNSNECQRITSEHVEQMSDFGQDYSVEDFRFDNY